MEVMVFGPKASVSLGDLNDFCKPEIVNLRFKIDPEFKLEGQICSVVHYSFYHLRQLAKIKHFLARQHFGTVIHAFITPWLDYCNAL